MGKPCAPAIESCSCISSAGLVRKLVWRLSFHQLRVKFMTPHELLAKNTWALVQDLNKIGKHMQVIKNELSCTVYIDTCIVHFRVLYQDGDAEIKSSIKREEPGRSTAEGFCL